MLLQYGLLPRRPRLDPGRDQIGTVQPHGRPPYGRQAVLPFDDRFVTPQLGVLTDVVEKQIDSGFVGVIGIRRAIEYYLGITHQNGRARVVEDGFESYVEGVEHGAPVISAMEFLQMGVQ